MRNELKRKENMSRNRNQKTFAVVKSKAGCEQVNVHRHCTNLGGNCLESSYIGDEEIRENY